MKKTYRNMTPASIRVSVYLNPRGGKAVDETIAKIAHATFQIFEGNLSATAKALGYSTKTVRRILGGINGSEFAEEGASVREGDSQSAERDLPQCN